MILAIDAGNTNVVFACFEGETVVHTWRADTKTPVSAGSLHAGLEEAGVKAEAITGGILASVVPGLNAPLEQAFRGVTEKDLIMVGADGVDPGIEVRVAAPDKVGADRLMNAVAGKHYYGAPVIVVDFGTATTFDVVGADGAFEGGAICPGIRLSLKALHDETAKLPLITLEKPEAVVGKDTEKAMKSGIFWGYVSLIEGMTARIRQELGGDAKTVATGGDAWLFAKHTDAIEDVRDDLTLQGLRLVYERNTR